MAIDEIIPLLGRIVAGDNDRYCKKGKYIMPKVSLKSIDQVTTETLSVYGVLQGTIDVILKTFHYANRCGITTHGIRRLPMYVEKIEAGHLNPKDEVEAVIDSDAVAVLDAKGGFGQVAAQYAVNLALEKATKYGISAVGVRNSNNFGTAGYYGDYAARHGMAAFVFANAAPAIAPTGGKKTIFGTNPICFAFPGSDKNNPIVLDMATTIAARSKIRLAAKNGEKIPMDWAIGSDGKPTDDPNEALKGSLLPMAGYKGYGLSLFMDVFAGLLAGSSYAGRVKPLTNLEADSGNGHLFVLIDTKRFMSEEELHIKVDYFYEAVKSCGDEGAVMLPGEPGYRKMAEQIDAVVISEKEFESVNEVASKLGVVARLEEV